MKHTKKTALLLREKQAAINIPTTRSSVFLIQRPVGATADIRAKPLG